MIEPDVTTEVDDMMIAEEGIKTERVIGIKRMIVIGKIINAVNGVRNDMKNEKNVSHDRDLQKKKLLKVVKLLRNVQEARKSCQKVRNNPTRKSRKARKFRTVRKDREALNFVKNQDDAKHALEPGQKVPKTLKVQKDHDKLQKVPHDDNPRVHHPNSQKQALQKSSAIQKKLTRTCGKKWQGKTIQKKTKAPEAKSRRKSTDFSPVSS